LKIEHEHAIPCYPLISDQTLQTDIVFESHTYNSYKNRVIYLLHLLNIQVKFSTDSQANILQPCNKFSDYFR